MNWFDLQAAGLEYVSPNVSLADGTDLIYDFFGLSLSDIPMWIYVVAFFGALYGARLFSHKLHRLIERLPGYWWFVTILLGVLFAYSIYTVLLLWNVEYSEIPGAIRKGEFGDSFGTINALFSGLAFSGVLITLLFQRKDLSATRVQISHQAFESQFYSMLGHQQEIVRNFDLQDPKTNDVIAEGRDCFRFWDRYIRHRYNICSRIPAGLDPHGFAYNQIFLEHRSDFRLYFRSLYSLFRFIDRSDHPKKFEFALMVRSLLSDYELKILFYNCLAPEGVKFVEYVYKFSLFDNLDDSMLLKSDHINYYARSAYGSNNRLLSKLDEPLSLPRQRRCHPISSPQVHPVTADGLITRCSLRQQ